MYKGVHNGVSMGGPQWSTHGGSLPTQQSTHGGLASLPLLTQQSTPGGSVLLPPVTIILYNLFLGNLPLVTTFVSSLNLEL